MSRKKFENGDAPRWGIPTPAQNYDYGGMGLSHCRDGAHYETVRNFETVHNFEMVSNFETVRIFETVQCTVSTVTSGNRQRNHRHQREWRRTTMGHTDTRTKL